MKKLWNRESLRSFFRKGKLPSEVHFSYLIDSSVNKIDDGFNKSDADGLQLSPTGSNNNVLSIYKAPSEQYPSWQLGLQDNETGAGLSFNSVQENADGSVDNTSRFFLAKNGNVGIGTSQPQTKLHVNGTFSTKTRIGSLTGQVPGDGSWHDVVANLDGAQAFEAVASIEGPAKRGKHAITHALALSTFGGSRHRIRQDRAYYGWFWNRIEFRWHGKTRNFKLQVRTRTHYGLSSEKSNYMIRFHVTRLWDPSVF